MITVISLGGSIVAPDAVDTGFLRQFYELIGCFLGEDGTRKFILVVGGGGTARKYQSAYAELTGGNIPHFAENADWIGIMATRLNAELVRALFHEYCPHEVVTDPTNVNMFTGRILVAAGWKPGFSSDNDAVLLAERFGANVVVNLSNIDQVMTADPKLDPSAKPLDAISWEDFRAMVGDNWTPGKNVPFDPVASKRAWEADISVICASGRNIPNLAKILNGEPFVGTTIGGMQGSRQ